jgi:N-methylhydantoinase A/oxoprolinase/acetone carboxylase beta subunit
MVRTSEGAGFGQVIGFDMGGTSTDVSHYAGELEREFETQVAGVRMRAPMMSIHTIAAGGGSILFFDGQRQRVGPDSAGANPGPACYRRGGPLTVTDCNVMLGKVQPAFFPRVFGPRGDEPLDAAVVREKFTALAGEIQRATGKPQTAEAVAERLRAHRRRQHGERDQVHLGAARPRRHRIHARLLRRGGRPARVPGGRRARHDARLHPSAGGRAFRVWDGPGRGAHAA